MIDIIIKGLSFGYDDMQILKNINLIYHSSDFLCITGPNGGGKTTMIKLILGLLNPNQGTIQTTQNSQPISTKLLGYVPQQIPINKSFPMSVLEVVLMGKINKKRFGFYTKDDKIDALKCLEITQVDKFKDKKISEISGGQRQRVYIARALASDAKILILDEPTASIDLKGRVQIYELLQNLNKNGIGVIMVSHDVNLAINYANKIAYVNQELVMHDIDNNSKSEFLSCVSHEHHFCDVELALRKKSC